MCCGHTIARMSLLLSAHESLLILAHESLPILSTYELTDLQLVRAYRFIARMSIHVQELVDYSLAHYV